MKFADQSKMPWHFVTFLNVSWGGLASANRNYPQRQNFYETLICTLRGMTCRSDRAAVLEGV